MTLLTAAVLVPANQSQFPVQRKNGYRVKKAAKKKVGRDENGVASVMRSLFRSFAMLVEQAADGRPQLRGLRVAHDPKADRFVAVHLGARVEFVLRIGGDSDERRAALFRCARI